MAKADHIYVSRGAYTHHGIDAGDGTVIHYSGEPGAAKFNAAIERASLDHFLQGGELKIRRYGKRDSALTTLKRAESRIGDSGYHLVTNNCEHFATWCCTGRSASEQVRGAQSLTAHGVLAGTTAAATTGVVGAIGAVSGVSGAGIMSGLATAGSVVGGSAAMGPAILGAAPALLSIAITEAALRDDESLPDDERAARRDGRTASLIGAGASTVGGVAAIGAAGTAGVSAAGITSGLAAIGATVGGGMAAGTVLVVAAPAVVAAGLGAGVFALSKWLRQPSEEGPREQAADVASATPS